MVLVGVHTPEFAFEQDVDNVKDAIKRFDIEYPVALDNDYKTWSAYDNHYWPAHYLIDQEGTITQIHFGEGAYLETENAIRSLLGLPALSDGKEAKVSMRGTTPETYLGYQRASAYTTDISIQKDKVVEYNYQGKLDTNQVGLKGSWLIGPESIQAESDGATIDLNFMAQHVYLVMKATSPAHVTVLLDGKPLSPEYRTDDMDREGAIPISQARMYTIVNLKDSKRHVLTLTFPKGVSAYAFTFG